MTTLSNKAAVAAAWEQRHALDNWRYHVTRIRNEDRGQGYSHETAREAFELAHSLAKYGAVPWAIDLTPTEVLTLATMILDPEVQP